MSFNKNTHKYEGYIYLIKNLINNKCYVGQTTTTIEHRWGQHSSHHNGHSNMIIVNAINKYGKENFSINELYKFEADSKSELLELLNNSEIETIKEYNTLTPNGYNITSGGNNVSSVLSKEVDAYTTDGKFIRSFESGNDADRYYNLSLGTAVDCCNGNTLATQDRKYTFRFSGDDFDKFDPLHYSRSRYIYKFDMDGNFIKEYPNLTQAAIDTVGYSTASSTINSSLDSNIKTAYGYYWSTDKTFDFNIENYRNRMPVDQYDFDGNKICTYNSASEACIAMGKTPEYVSGLLSVCRGQSSQAHNYIWRFSGDPFDLYTLPIKLPKVAIDKYDIDGNYLGTYESIQDALRSVNKGIDQGCNIRKGCLGISPIVFNHVWRFKGEPYSKYPVYKNRGGSDKPVDQYTLDGKYVNTYPSAAEGGRNVGLKNGSQVTSVCKAQRYSAGGYLWRYHNVPLDSFTVVPKKAAPKKGQPVNVYDINDKFLYMSESAKAIAKEIGCCKDTITQKCRGVSNHIFNNQKYFYSCDNNQPDKSKVTQPIYPKKEVS